MQGRNPHPIDRKDIVTCHAHTYFGVWGEDDDVLGRLIRTALTLAVLAQGDVRLLGVCDQLPMYFS
jgi:hypothetical protein